MYIKVFPGTTLNVCKDCLWKTYIVFHFVSYVNTATDSVPFEHLLDLCHIGFFKLRDEKDRQNKGVI